MISMVVPLGATVGSLFGSRFAGYGRRKGLIYLNGIAVIGLLITQIKAFIPILIG